VEMDRLRSGKASVLSITPFVGLQTACHARLLDSHGPISSGRDLISRALQPRFYMSRIWSAMSMAFATSCALLRRDICGCAALIPLLEKDKAVPLEFKRSPVHPLGKHSPTVARFRRTARRPDRAVGLFASPCAWGFCKFANEAFRATWRLRCRSIVHISLGYMTEPLAWFNWIVLMMGPPSNPPGGSSTATMWSFGRWIGL
jgi:hypothetical protein